jgi:hypothetical protein
MVEVQDLLADHIQYAPGGADHDIRPAFDLRDLRGIGLTTIHSHNARANVGAVNAHRFGNL